MTTKRHELDLRYARFSEINGDHPLRHAIPNAYVDYRARTRHGGKLVYFNFDLAKEMGLIPSNDEHIITKELSRAVLDTFAIEIINEYDVIHKTVFPPLDIRPNYYMATRYLQLQHPNRRGLTSGDGRSIWNGFFRGIDAMWDVSSCGTGATRLSPASAISNRFYKTGDDNVSYGCGRTEILDGVGAALMSDIFHRNGIVTERALAVIEFDDGTAINVRAGKNLLRPAHFFRYLKQSDLEGLRQTVDYYIQRQTDNGEWPRMRSSRDRYRYFLERIAVDFARATATFEMEYIFCWLDWDGDNILTDGAIIDYGSVRQFGLFHHEYRYDDTDRFSTTIPQQRAKARYIVQCFAQIVDFLQTGTKLNVHRFRNSSALKLFDTVFEWTKDELALHKMGFTPAQREVLLQDNVSARQVRRFRETCRYFEKVKARRGPYEVADGITWDAVFCVRDILRELPVYLLDNNLCVMAAPAFVGVLKSSYADAIDLRINSRRARRIAEFQTLYLELAQSAATRTRKSMPNILRGMRDRSAVINRYDRVTGDAIVKAAQTLLLNFQNLSVNELQQTMEDFVDVHVLMPGYKRRMNAANTRNLRHARDRIFDTMIKIVQIHRDGL